MIEDFKILIGKGENPVYLLPQMANRHGLIAGATGTGKTTTLKVLAEGFSDLGVPVFLADVKGDISSMAEAGEMNEKISSRLDGMGVDKSLFDPHAYPVRFWDVFETGGIPVRAKISSIGPTLFSRLLNLTDAQTGVLNITFHVADDNGLELIDLKDLRSMLTYISKNRAELTATYGNVASSSVGAIQRALLTLEDQGGNMFFGEPELDIRDWLKTDENGRGMVNILHCPELVKYPLLYSMFMLWMLSELYETLPEVGDVDVPKIVYFFDEAHMLFNGAPKALLDKVVQIVKLVRSKGVGIYFITQSPADIPDEVLAQLNNRVQHALRAYTPAEQRAVRTAAQSFRANPKFKTEDAIANMGTGVALVSMLDEEGAPTVVEQATICPPQSSFTALVNEEREQIVNDDPLYASYKEGVDSESAYEILNAEQEKIDAAKAEADAQKAAEAEAKAAEKAERDAEKAKQAQYKAEGKDKYGRTQLQQSIAKASKSTARVIGRDVGKSITRGLLGTSKIGKTAQNAAGQMVGSLFSEALNNLFK